MLDFFGWIVTFFENIWTIVENFFSNFLQMLSLLLNITTTYYMFSTFIPSVIYASMSIVILVGAIKLVLGWGNSQ